MTGNSSRAYLSLGLALAAVGRVKEAAEAVEVAIALDEQTILTPVLVHQLARIGQIDRARSLLASVCSRDSYVSPYWEAYAYVGLGDHDAALAALERSVSDREWFLLFLKHEPGFQELRRLARFDEIRRRIGLP